MESVTAYFEVCGVRHAVVMPDPVTVKTLTFGDHRRTYRLACGDDRGDDGDMLSAARPLGPYHLLGFFRNQFPGLESLRVHSYDTPTTSRARRGGYS